MGFAPELPPPAAVDPATPAIERNATIAFPVLGPTRLAAPDCGDAQDVVENAGASGSAAEIEAAGLCAEEAPGIVFGVKLQPVLAVVDGVITDVIDVPGETISVTITDTSGRSFELAGFNDDTPGTNDGAAPAASPPDLARRRGPERARRPGPRVHGRHRSTADRHPVRRADRCNRPDPDRRRRTAHPPDDHRPRRHRRSTPTAR